MFASVGQKGIFCSGWGSSGEVTAGLSRGPISVTAGAFIQRLTRGLEGDVVVVETEMPSCCAAVFEDGGRGCDPEVAPLQSPYFGF